MKNKISLILLTFLLSFNIFGQSDQLTSTISECFKSGQAFKLEKHLNNIVNLELHEYDDNFSKKQIVVILQEFFDKQSVKNFSINHQGSSDTNSKYIIATYKTSKASYRVYFLMKMNNETFLIHQIQFEEE